MKRIYLILCTALPLLAVAASCEKEQSGNSGGDGDKAEPATSHTITILTDDGSRRQEIDGFGASFGWSESVYQHPQRETALEDLYGDAGLKLNIYRGEVHNTYLKGDANSRSCDFRLDDGWNIGAADAGKVTAPDLEEFAQPWIINYLTDKGYSENIYYFFSVWSPPAVWKSTGSTDTGTLNMDYAQDFADMLSDFVKQYNEYFGINIYGISGWNEPDQAMGGWDGCQWTYQDMTDFCIKNLRPALGNYGVNDTKIIFDELPWWNNACEWMRDSYEYDNKIADQNIVAAGHAYSSNIKNLQTMPVEVTGENGSEIHSWITETCDDKKNEGTLWSDGLAWAENYQSYLMNANVNAVVWWAAMRKCSTTGENLLDTDAWEPNATTYTKMERYYTIGQFSRYIPRGAYRYIVDSPNIKDGKQQVATDPDDKNNRINGDVTFSSYLWKDAEGKENFTIVIVNPSEKFSFSTAVEIAGKKIDSMTSITSTEAMKWKTDDCKAFESGKRYVSVPKYSVVTVTGTCSDAD